MVTKPLNQQHTQQEAPTAEETRPNEITLYRRALLRGSWLIIIAALIAGVLAYAFRSRQGITYTSEARIYIGNALALLDPNSEQISIAEQIAPIYAQRVQSYEILNPVIDQLGLNTDAERLAAYIRTSIVQQTPILVISATANTAEQAMQIANLTAESLVDYANPDTTELENREIAEVQANVTELEALVSLTSEQAFNKLEALNQAIEDDAPQEEIDALNAEYVVISDQLNELRANLAQMLQTLLGLSGDPNILEIIETARLGTPNPGTSPFMSAIMGAVAGTFFGVGVLLLQEYLNNTVRGEYEVYETLNVPVIGEIKKIRLNQAKGDYRQELVNPESAFGEGYLTLFKNLLPMIEEHTGATWLVTSLNQKDGRTFTVANLGIVASQANLQTLIIDGDLRNPSLHRTLDLTNTAGLAQMLAGPPPNLNVHAIKRKMHVQQNPKWPNLHVIASGLDDQIPVTENLLNYTFAPPWIKAMHNTSNFDLVIFDSAACFDVSDPFVLATKLHAKVLVVVKAGRSKKADMQQMQERFNLMGIDVMGVILNYL